MSAQYVLDWSDEFNGTTLDKTKWNVEKGGGSNWNNTAVDDPRVIEVSNGSLKLKGIKNPNYNGSIENVGTIDENSVWTGAIDSHHKYGFKYGKCEIRARIESAPRAWPALWLMPTHSVYGGNPLSGEIDIVEHLNYDNFYYTTVHTEYHLTNKQDPERWGGGTFTNDDNEWVVYGMEWTEQKLDFFRNGVLYHTVNKGNGLYVNGLLRWPFDEEFYLILSQQIGGGWVDGEAASQGLKMTDADLPLTMEIDYVRVYKKSTTTINYDLAATGVSRADNNSCGKDFELDVDITNNGAQAVSNFDVEVYIDNQLVKTESVSQNIASGGSSSVSITGLSVQTDGAKSIKVIVTNPDGNADEVAVNDEATVTVALTTGELHEFFITEDAVKTGMSWVIKDGSTTVLSSNGLTATTSGSDQIQSFCLADGCYEIVVTDAFGSSNNGGGCSADEWVSGKEYCAGEEVTRNGNLYKSKWCAISDPASAGQWGQWEDMGACAPTPATPGTYGLRKVGGTTYFSLDDQSYTSPHTTAFCTEGQGINVDFTISSKTATNCESVEFTSTASPVGTSYSWDFGSGADPSTANGVGPHTVTYASAGDKSVSLTVDGFSESKTNAVTITNAKNDATVSIALKNEIFPVCLDTVSTYYATTTYGGNASVEWYVDGNKTSGSDSIQVPNVNGTTVQAKITSDENCVVQEEVESNVVTILTMDCISGADELDENSYIIYPNPMEEVVLVEGELLQSVTIINALGEVVQTHTYKNMNKANINTSELSPGYYLVTIRANDGQLTKRVFKK